MNNIEHDRMYVKFFQLGGTWLMRERIQGGLEGVGNFDDQELKRLEQSFGLDRESSPQNISMLEKELAREVYRRFESTPAELMDEMRPFASWCPEFHNQVTGLIYTLFNGDSSHFRPALVAPTTSILLEEAIKDPNIPIIGAQGTDTADVGALPIVDVLVFDTNLPPFIFSGADHSYLEPRSDAPDNFERLAKLARIDVRWYLQYCPWQYVFDSLPESGVYWVYHNHLYHVVDLVKVSPQEEREIERNTTFFSPNVHAVPLDDWLTGDFLKGLHSDWQHLECKEIHPAHVALRVTMEDLYDTLSSIYTIDLGNQNRIADDIAQILNPDNRAIIVAAHGLGNASNPIRWACIEAAKQGKLVIDTSRCLVGNVNQRYAGSLLDANNTPGELLDTNKMIISGRRFNRTVARAVATRALLEGFNQQGTQQLLDCYHRARFIDQEGYVSLSNPSAK